VAGLVVFVFWISLNVWATSFVMRHVLEQDALRNFYYAVIWLFPFLGAAFAILITGLGAKRSASTSDEKMFQSVVEKRSQPRGD